MSLGAGDAYACRRRDLPMFTISYPLFPSFCFLLGLFFFAFPPKNPNIPSHMIFFSAESRYIGRNNHYYSNQDPPQTSEETSILHSISEDAHQFSIPPSSTSEQLRVSLGPVDSPLPVLTSTAHDELHSWQVIPCGASPPVISSKFQGGGHPFFPPPTKTRLGFAMMGLISFGGPITLTRPKFEIRKIHKSIRPSPGTLSQTHLYFRYRSILCLKLHSALLLGFCYSIKDDRRLHLTLVMIPLEGMCFFILRNLWTRFIRLLRVFGLVLLPNLLQPSRTIVEKSSRTCAFFGLSEQILPPYEGVTPLPQYEDVTPLPQYEDVTPLPQYEDFTPLPQYEDVIPLPQYEDVIHKLLPRSIDDIDPSLSFYEKLSWFLEKTFDVLTKNNLSLEKRLSELSLSERCCFIISFMEQLLFPNLLPIWIELDIQAALVLQGSSSRRMFFSAFDAVDETLWVSLDAVSLGVFEIIVLQFLMISDLYHLSISHVTIIWLFSLTFVAFLSMISLLLDVFLSCFDVIPPLFEV